MATVPFYRYEAKARLYDYSNRYFICTVSGISETRSITVLDAECDNDVVGSSILEHLAEYSFKEIHKADDKLTDWPAFRASGAKSVKAFEKDLWQVHIAVMNSAVMFDAQPRKSNDPHDLFASTSANRNLPDMIGAALRSALSAAKLLREHGGF